MKHFSSLLIVLSSVKVSAQREPVVTLNLELPKTYLRLSNLEMRDSTVIAVPRKPSESILSTNKTFAKPQMYLASEIKQGMKAMWNASLYNGTENVGIFTSAGLLVLCNLGNKRDKISIETWQFMASITNDNSNPTKVKWGKDEDENDVWLEILGMVHTHPIWREGVIQAHSPQHKKDSWEYRYWNSGVGNYVIADDGIYQATKRNLSLWLGSRHNNTVYQLIIDKYKK